MPLALAQAFEERHGVRMLHAWGMTETSPMCTVARVPARRSTADRAWELRATQGRPVPFVELRLVDDAGEEVPWDGDARPARSRSADRGSRAPTTATTTDSSFDDGWLRTGDIAHVDPDGWVAITDRSKDVIKSGGEWISSVELENELMAHPARARGGGDRGRRRALERAAAGLRRARRGRASAPAALREHLRGRVARWWLPDEFAFIDEVPKTSVGKFDKKALRAALADGRLDGARAGAVTRPRGLLLALDRTVVGVGRRSEPSAPRRGC